ncbi:hypothetical protein GCM10023238_06620 [Streptomyces heliomycini]
MPEEKRGLALGLWVRSAATCRGLRARWWGERVFDGPGLAVNLLINVPVLLEAIPI